MLVDDAAAAAIGFLVFLPGEGTNILHVEDAMCLVPPGASPYWSRCLDKCMEISRHATSE